MGVDTSHDAWHGSYSLFNAFRDAVCQAAGLGKLRDHEGFGGVIPWPSITTEPLVALLDHSDCDGSIPVNQLGALALRLRQVAPQCGEWEPEAMRFAYGCGEALVCREPLEFH